MSFGVMPEMAFTTAAIESTLEAIANAMRDGDTLISDEATVTFDSVSTVLAERIKQIVLTVRSGAYDRHKDYYLVGRDAATSVEVLRVAYRIDLAFSNDF